MDATAIVVDRSNSVLQVSLANQAGRVAGFHDVCIARPIRSSLRPPQQDRWTDADALKKRVSRCQQCTNGKLSGDAAAMRCTRQRR